MTYSVMGLKISVTGLMQTLQGIQDPQLILQRGCYSGQIFIKTFLVKDQTRGRVFSPISKHREVGWKNEAQPSFF